MEATIIEDFFNLFSVLPDLITYVIFGYIFIKVFSFCTSHQRQNDLKNELLACLTVGFVINSVFDLIIPYQMSGEKRIFILICLCIVIPFIFAKILNSRLFYKILRCLHIHRTVNNNIWSDIIDHEHALWIIVTFKDINIEYFGKIVQIEDNQRFPLVTISQYRVSKLNGHLIEDYHGDPTRRVLIDASKADSIEFIYHDNSNIIVNDGVFNNNTSRS